MLILKAVTISHSYNSIRNYQTLVVFTYFTFQINITVIRTFFIDFFTDDLSTASQKNFFLLVSVLICKSFHNIANLPY